MSDGGCNAVEVSFIDTVDRAAYVGGEPSPAAARVLATRYADEPVPRPGGEGR